MEARVSPPNSNCRLLLGFTIVLLVLISSAEAAKLEALKSNHSKCVYDDRTSCKEDNGSECEWCELPQECYHIEVARRLGASCNGSQRRQLKQVQECSDVSDKERCLSFDHCRWCQSDILDDGCFRAWDARRLPSQIFECRKELQ